jgi:hypothetical protein
MSDTVATVVQFAQRRLPDLQTSWGISLADYVHREIMTYIPDLIMTGATANPGPTSITLTAGTYEYALAEAQMQIDYAQYQTASGAVAQNLAETTIYQLDKERPTWRSDIPGQNNVPSVPFSFYISSNASGATLGLYPYPLTSTSVGYPIVQIFGSQRTVSPLLSSTPIPPTCLNSLLYVEGICYYASIEIRPQMAAAFKATYMEQIALNRKYVSTRNEGVKIPIIRNIRDGVIPVETAPATPPGA